MALNYSKISIPNGARDVAIDLTGDLETSETVDVDPTAISSDGDFLVASGAIANGLRIEKDEGGYIEIGKGVQFHIATATATEYADYTSFPAEGSEGTYYYAGEEGTMWTWDATDEAYEEVEIPDSVDVRVWFQGTSGTAERHKITIALTPALDR